MANKNKKLCKRCRIYILPDDFKQHENTERHIRLSTHIRKRDLTNFCQVCNRDYASYRSLVKHEQSRLHKRNLLKQETDISFQDFFGEEPSTYIKEETREDRTRRLTKIRTRRWRYRCFVKREKLKKEKLKNNSLLNKEPTNDFNKSRENATVSSEIKKRNGR